MPRAGLEPATVRSSANPSHINLDAYSNYLKVKYSPRTQREYLSVMNRFALRYKEISKETITEWLSIQSEGGYNKSIKAFKVYLSLFDMEHLLKGFDYKYKDGQYVIDDLTAKDERLTYEELTKVLNIIQDDELKAFLLICRQSRPCEALSLTWEDIDLEHGIYNASKVHKGKSKRAWGGFIDQELKECLLRLKGKGDRPFSHSWDYYIDRFKEICKKVLGKEHTLKEIRSCYADYVLDKTQNPITANLLQGRSPKSIGILLQHYAKPRLSKLKKVYDGLQ